MTHQLTAAFLHECFTYDRDIGFLSWRDRPRSHFSTDNAHVRFQRNLAGHVAGSFLVGDNRIRVVLTVKRKVHSLYAHRVVWCMLHGAWPKTLLDHKDGNGLNNRADNLREATKAQNAYNSGPRSDNKTGFKGVRRLASGRFEARIKAAAGQRYIGRFATALEAAAAYAGAAERLHGEFARTEPFGGRP